MRKLLRFALIVLVVLSGAFGSSQMARAGIDDSSGTNTEEGDNDATTRQSGRVGSGDSVGGQVSGVVSSGRASVDARNASSNSDVSSGEVRGSNSASSFTGLNASRDDPNIGATPTDISDLDCSEDFGCNIQEGDNRIDISQLATYTTGDAVAGEVIGMVTAVNGSASIVAANRSDDVAVQTGDATGSNDVAAFTGLHGGGLPTVETTDLAGIFCATNLAGCNLQEGNNRTVSRQMSTATTGDGVAGQVIGAVSAGTTSIDARNTSTTARALAKSRRRHRGMVLRVK